MIGNFTPINYLSNQKYQFNNIKQNRSYTPNFRGMSLASDYHSSFEYLAAKILDGSRKMQIDKSKLSSKRITELMDYLFKFNKVFKQYVESNPLKIKWKSYIPQDIREYCTEKVNDARAGRLQQWKDFLENPDSAVADETDFASLRSKIRQSPALKFVIWHNINSELQANNRHIPVPFDLTALDETVSHFENLDPKFRAVRCSSPSFLDMYTHRLRDNLLMKKGLSDNQSVWVRIPSIKKDPANKAQNIAELEILSNKNWCTRSSLDKAEDALSDGDFYIYLDRNDENMWEPVIGMACSRGKIDQIQGKENNNLIPHSQLENIKTFLESQGIQCNSGVSDEGPKALQQILICEKLAQVDEKSGKNLAKAIKDKDLSVLSSILGINYKIKQDGTYEIKNYRPQFLLNEKSGLVAPYSFLGIDEDLLLENVSTINGNLYLSSNRSSFCVSNITKFPPKLEKVEGKVYCNQEQYSKYENDLLRLVNGDESKVVIR